MRLRLNKSDLYVLFILIFTQTILSIVCLSRSIDNDYAKILTLSFGFVFLLITFYISLNMKKYPLLSVYSLFFIFSITYNAGSFISIFLSFNANTNLANYFSLSQITETGYYLLLFHYLLHFCFLVCFSSSGGGNVGNDYQLVAFKKNDLKFKAIALSGAIIVFFSIIPYLIYIFNSITLVKTSGYLSYWYALSFSPERILHPRFTQISLYLIPGALMMYIGTKNKKNQILALMLILINLFAYSIIGSRSKAVLPVFSIIFSYIYFKRNKLTNKKQSKIIILCFCVFFLFYAVAVSRIRSNANNNYLEFSSISYIVEFFKETGISIIPSIYTMQNVPKDQDFWFGGSYILPIFEAIPFVKRILSTEIIENMPFLWFNKNFDPLRYESGGGWGYSYIAEGYANFGMISLLLLPPLLAICLKKMDYYLEYRSPFFSNLIILSLPNILFLARSSIDVSIKPILHYSILPTTFALLTFLFLKEVIKKKLRNT